MKLEQKILKYEFEYRIFISLSIVSIGALLSFFVFNNSPSVILLIGGFAGMAEEAALNIGYGIIIVMIVFASLLRMWAGSILSSSTVMSFKIQSDDLHLDGPYLLVRNPIYFSDFAAITSITLCLHPIGLIIPLLILLHYLQLIKYEEINFGVKYHQKYEEYLKTTPKILPSIASLIRFIKNSGSIFLNSDGIRHNALYVLFVPGFITAFFTHEFLHALLIGLPGVIDWAVIHTVIGVNPTKKGIVK